MAKFQVTSTFKRKFPNVLREQCQNSERKERRSKLGEKGG